MTVPKDNKQQSAIEALRAKYCRTGKTVLDSIAAILELASRVEELEKHAEDIVRILAGRPHPYLEPSADEPSTAPTNDVFQKQYERWRDTPCTCSQASRHPTEQFLFEMHDSYCAKYGQPSTAPTNQPRANNSNEIELDEETFDALFQGLSESCEAKWNVDKHAPERTRNDGTLTFGSTTFVRKADPTNGKAGKKNDE